MLDFSTYKEAEPKLKQLVDDWSAEVDHTKARRDTRKVRLDIESMKATDDLDEDELFIPMRVIDATIEREQPAYVGYLTTSRRTCVFTCISDFNKNTDNLEAKFTKGTRYKNWELPHFKVLDGSQAHGWDAAEVIFDTTKPFNVGIEHIGHEKLLFDRRALDIQACSYVMRRYDLTLFQLLQFVQNFNFNGDVVAEIGKALKDTQDGDKPIECYKVFMKDAAGYVHVAWYTTDYSVKGWLKDPAPLFVGIKEPHEEIVEEPSVNPLTGMPTMQQRVDVQWLPTKLKEYPIFLKVYKETEEDVIVDHEGRIVMDEALQEAVSAITSSFATGVHRATQIFGSPENDDAGDGQSVKALESLDLSKNRIVDKPFKFWSAPYPDFQILSAIQFFQINHAQETNQVDFATNNRKDSRKTAKEIAASQQQQSLLNGVNVTLFSSYLRSVYAFVWRIAQSQALQGNIVIIPVYGPDGKVVGNDDKTVALEYEVLPAGDVDVIQRQETLDKMMNFWPVIQTTPLAEAFLMDIVATAFPENYTRYSQIMAQAKADQVRKLKGLLFQASTLIQGSISPEEFESLPPEKKQQLQMIMQQIQAELQNGQQGGQRPTQPSAPDMAGIGPDKRIGNSANSDAIK